MYYGEPKNVYDGLKSVHYRDLKGRLDRASEMKANALSHVNLRPVSRPNVRTTRLRVHAAASDTALVTQKSEEVTQEP